MQSVPAGLDPPLRLDDQGRVRAVGVEIEMTGLTVGAIADTVARLFEGRATRETDYLARVATELGEFQVKADLALLQRIGERREEAEGAVIAAVRDALASAVERIAPFEVASPPLPYPALPRMDELAEELGRAGGLGTDAGMLLALGLQLNPQVPRLTAESIHAHVRAYAVLEPWLRLRRGVDVARRLATFVDPYPDDYVELLIGQEQAPSMTQLIDDYLRHNPTRNRSLDMLPLLAHIDRDRVAATVPDKRIKSRPTFHYRLPDSRVGHPGLLVTDEWRHWLVVERVAIRPELIRALAPSYRDPKRIDELLSAHQW